MRKYFHQIACGLFIGLCLSCAQTDEETAYPSLITEFAELYADSEGTLYQIRPDRKPTYYLANPLPGYHPHTEYRAACTYSFPETDSTAVLLYGLERVVVMRDSTGAEYPGTDPLQVVSIWDGGAFINLHLSVKTQGGTHYLGYRLDSVRTDATQRRSAYLTLYHNQNRDPLSYSQKLYGSLPKSSLDSVIGPGDSIYVRIHTFTGIRTWTFSY